MSVTRSFIVSRIKDINEQSNGVSFITVADDQKHFVESSEIRQQLLALHGVPTTSIQTVEDTMRALSDIVSANSWAKVLYIIFRL